MARFQNLRTGDIVSVFGPNADAKEADGRFTRIKDAGPVPLEDYTIKQLQAYASEQGVDLDGASKKANIIARLQG